MLPKRFEIWGLWNSIFSLQRAGISSNVRLIFLLFKTWFSPDCSLSGIREGLLFDRDVSCVLLPMVNMSSSIAGKKPYGFLGICPELVDREPPCLFCHLHSCLFVSINLSVLILLGTKTARRSSRQFAFYMPPVWTNCDAHHPHFLSCLFYAVTKTMEKVSIFLVIMVGIIKRCIWYHFNLYLFIYLHYLYRNSRLA